MSNILIVAPHPDDETLGCAGVIAARTRAGHKVHVVVLSDGGRLFQAMLGIDTDPSPREVSKRRKRETETAFRLLGGDPGLIRYFDYPDGSLADCHTEIAVRLLPVFAELLPAEVYVTAAHELHPDHCAANRIVRAALSSLPAPRPALFQYFVGPKPDFLLDAANERIVETVLAEFYELKRMAIRCFDCHLEIQSPLQTRPIWADGAENQYLHPTEKFVVPLDQS